MIWSRLAVAFPAAALVVGLAGAPALAQIGQSDAPVEITSQQGEYLQNEGRGIYTGNVVATQGDAQIKTDKLTVICSKAPAQGSGAAPSCDELEVLVAEGNVFYSAPDVRIRGSKAEYDFPTDTITITGDVILSRGEDGVVRGTRVIYSIGEGRTVITAGEKRVITVFNTAKKPPAKPTTPAQPLPPRTEIPMDARNEMAAVAYEADDRDGLRAANLAKSFKGRQVVKDVSLHLKRGEIVGLLGPNGAGKTTCFYMIMGLITADGGRVTMDGADITALPMYQRARLGAGYLPQENSIFRGMSVWDNVMAVAELTEDTTAKRQELTASLLEELQISRLAKQNANSLSGGERRRVEIARALASRPHFMLLDEPFTGIDPLAVSDISDLVRYLKSRGLGVLITDHQVRETLAIVDRASIIYDGRVLKEGSPQEILNDEDVRRVYLGARFQ